jgi:flagellar assembly protein FliH
MFEGRIEAAAAHATAAPNGFTPGLSSRHNDAASALRRAFADRPIGFAPADLLARIRSAAPETGPKHFHPADRDSNPTEGWDPLDATAMTTPFIDPIEAARAAGYAEGLAAANAGAAQAVERDRALLDNLLAALRADDRIDRDAIAGKLRQTVTFLVGKLVGEIGISADILAARIEAAAALLADATESAMLRVHPDDVALLDGRLPSTIFAVGDEAVARGSFVLEAASTIVEDGPDLWLEQLTHAIDRVAVPRA